MTLATDRLRNFGFLVRDVYRLYVKHFERAAGEIDLTLPQCKVLGHLSRNEGISQARLAELTDTDPMTLVRTLDRMQQDEWIERRPDPEDRRAHPPGATPATVRCTAFSPFLVLHLPRRTACPASAVIAAAHSPPAADTPACRAQS